MIETCKTETKLQKDNTSSAIKPAVFSGKKHLTGFDYLLRFN